MVKHFLIGAVLSAAACCVSGAVQAECYAWENQSGHPVILRFQGPHDDHTVTMATNGVYPNSGNLCYSPNTYDTVHVIGGKASWNEDAVVFGLNATGGRYIIR
jgi:hypothetical protein